MSEKIVRDLGELGINLQKIVSRLLKNQNLLKLLYYTDKDPLAGEDFTEEEKRNYIYEKRIKVVPRVGPQETAMSTLTMRVVRGRMNQENQEFQNITIHFEIFVPMTQWLIKDSNLRPFCIMSELSKSINGKVINGMGRLTGGDFQLNFLTDEMSCYEVWYDLIEYE